MNECLLDIKYRHIILICSEGRKDVLHRRVVTKSWKTSSCCYKELESVGRNRRLFGLQVISLQLFGWACSLFTCQLRKSSYDIVLFIPLATPAILVEEESILAESLWLIFIIYIENSRVYCRPRTYVGLGFLFFTFCAHYVLLPSCHYTYDTVIRKDVFIMQP